MQAGSELSGGLGFAQFWAFPAGQEPTLCFTLFIILNILNATDRIEFPLTRCKRNPIDVAVTNGKKPDL